LIVNEDLFAMFLGFVTLLIPIIAILTYHQRKMAEIIHMRANSEQHQAETDALRREVAELRDRLNQRMLETEFRSQPRPENLEPPIRPSV